jgi:hypothetical protein
MGETMSRQLFEDRHRTDGSKKRHDENSFAFLDRVSDIVFGRVRALLNEWFARWPIETRESLGKRLQSRRDDDFVAAFWELYLHEGIRRLAENVSVEPPSLETARRGDFVVSLAQNITFTLEARFAGESQRRRARARRLLRAYDLIDRIPNTDFFIDLQIQTEGSDNPPAAQVRDQIATWLQELDRSQLRPLLEAGHWREMPTRAFPARDWTFTARAIPVSDEGAASPPNNHGLIGIYPGGGGWADPDRIRDALHAKRASQYDTRLAPYVVAILDGHPLSGPDVLMDALYGDDAIEISRGAARPSEAVSIRKSNGYWQPARNTRLSAVLYGRELMPWSVASIAPTMWLNPWAQNPLPTRLPWVSHAEVDKDGMIAFSEPAIPPHRHFGLPSGWPGPERPFRS